MKIWFRKFLIRLGWRRCRHCNAVRRPVWALVVRPVTSSSTDGTIPPEPHVGVTMYRWMCPACWRTHD